MPHRGWLLLLELVTFVELLNRALGPRVLGTENIKYKIVRVLDIGMQGVAAGDVSRITL